jgi:hypothetical protein
MADIEAGLQRTVETNRQLDRLNPLDRMNLLNNSPRFDWVNSHVNPLYSSPITPPLGGMTDLRSEVDRITSGPLYSPRLPIKIK